MRCCWRERRSWCDLGTGPGCEIRTHGGSACWPGLMLSGLNGGPARTAVCGDGGADRGHEVRRAELVTGYLLQE